jgi:hypothetical protein
MAQPPLTWCILPAAKPNLFASVQHLEKYRSPRPSIQQIWQTVSPCDFSLFFAENSRGAAPLRPFSAKCSESIPNRFFFVTSLLPYFVTSFF